MINFFDELSEKFKMHFNKMDGDFKIIYISSGVYLEGQRGVISFCDSEISFKLKKGKITFYGSKLFIKDLEPDFVVVSGQIDRIERI